MNFTNIKWSILDAPYTCDGRGMLRIEVYRTPEQMKIDNACKKVTRNLVYWKYDLDTPMMNKKCIDEVLPLSIVLKCFEQAFGVTKANHLEYAKASGRVGFITPDTIVNATVQEDDDMIDPSLVISDIPLKPIITNFR